MPYSDTGAPIRGEMWVLTWGPESTAGTAATNLTNIFGVHQTATLPDPKADINTFWMLGNNSYRNYYIAYKGKKAISGSIPDSLLLNGVPLYLPIGKKSTTGTATGTGASVLSSATVIGATTANLTSATGYPTNGTGYIQVGAANEYTFTIASATIVKGDTYTNNSITFTVISPSGSAQTQVLCTGSGAPLTAGTLTRASGTGASTLSFSVVTNNICECRRISSVLVNALTLNQPLDFAHMNGTTCAQVTSPYTHTVIETFQLPTITLHAEMYSADRNLQLVREFYGGRVGRSTITAREGEYLTQSFDDLDFTNMAWYAPVTSYILGTEPLYSAALSTPVSPAYPTPQPYLFSYGSMALNGNTFTRVRAFRLDITNNLTPKYYIQSTVNNPQLPFEYREGQRTYKISTDIDVVDATLYAELQRQGTYSSVYRGFQTTLTFSRTGVSGTESITISTPPAGWDTLGGGNDQGCLIASGNYDISSQEPIVHTTQDITARSVGIVVLDYVANLPESGYDL
jgi:hypothetical protein